MSKYRQVKEKVAIPLIYSKLFITFSLAYLCNVNPKITKSEKRGTTIVFTADSVKTLLILTVPILSHLLLLVGAIIQIFGIFNYIWIWVVVYMSFSFDYIWLSDEEEVRYKLVLTKLLNESKEIEEAVEPEEQRKKKKTT